MAEPVPSGWASEYADLVRRFRAGEIPFGWEFYDLLHRAGRRWVGPKVPPRDLADVVQMAIVAHGKYFDRGKYKGWSAQQLWGLYQRQVRNAVRDYWRRIIGVEIPTPTDRDESWQRQRPHVVSTDPETFKDHPQGGPDVSKEVAKRELFEELRMAVSQLPSEIRRVLESYLKAESLREAARSLKMSVRQVRKLLQQAYKMIADWLRTSGFDEGYFLAE